MGDQTLGIWLNTADCSIEELERIGLGAAEWQRVVNWWIGDVARAARRRLGDNYAQVFPEWVSPGLIQRCERVANAYPRLEDRNPLATWTQHMQVANEPDRIERVAAAVAKGQTSDESARAANRWLLAVDVNYYVHRHWHSGAGVESARQVAGWIRRTVDRLRESGLTDVACCFDSPVNDRKQLTESWPDKYKDRPPKDRELADQLRIVRDLLTDDGFACVSVQGYEADDCMASLAKQFRGKVTLLTQDKDCRQCLDRHVNMLLDVTWDEARQQHDHHWLTAKDHESQTGIKPRQWQDYQALRGDPTDGIRGAEGVGDKHATQLVLDHGSAAGAIAAAQQGDERIKPRIREALLEFAPKLDVTLKLVTLVDSLTITQATRLS